MLPPWLVAVTMVAAVSMSVAAQPIVVESRIEDTRGEIDSIVVPVVTALGASGYRTSADLARQLEDLVPAPTSIRLTAPAILARAQSGIDAWHNGNIAVAVATIDSLWGEITRDPGAVVLEPSVQKTVFRALVILAMARQRQSEPRGETMEEVLRSFPDEAVTEAAFTPATARLYADVKSRLERVERGALTVTVDDPTVNIWINEQFVNSGEATKSDLIPGRYRVYLRRGRVDGRPYVVEVESGRTATLDVSWGFDAALSLGPRVGFVFETDAARVANEAAFATRLAGLVDAPRIVALAVTTVAGARALVGNVIDAQTGKVERAAALPLDGDAPLPLAEFASYLAGAGERPAGSLELDPATQLPPVPPPPPRRRPFRLVKWGVGAAAVGALAGGGVLLYLDGRPTCGSFPCERLYDTRNLGLGVLAGGAVLAVATATMFYLDRNLPTAAVVLPARGGVVGAAAWRF